MICDGVARVTALAKALLIVIGNPILLPHWILRVLLLGENNGGVEGFRIHLIRFSGTVEMSPRLDNHLPSTISEVCNNLRILIWVRARVRCSCLRERLNERLINPYSRLRYWVLPVRITVPTGCLRVVCMKTRVRGRRSRSEKGWGPSPSIDLYYTTLRVHLTLMSSQEFRVEWCVK